MNSNEEFKAKLETGNISELVKFIASKMLEFKVTTWIATDENIPEIQAETEAENSQSQIAPNFCLRTKFSLLEGIEHQLGKSVLTSESYLDLREYHLSQVERLDETVKNNLEILKKIVEVVEQNRNTKTTEKMVLLDQENISTSDLNLDLSKDDSNKSNKIISRTSQNSVLFLADDTLITNGDFKQHDNYNNINIDSQTRKELKQEDWGDWLDAADENIGAETATLLEHDRQENNGDRTQDN
jgi:hypothetical protein